MPAAVSRVGAQIAGIVSFLLVVSFFSGKGPRGTVYLDNEFLRGFKTVLVSIVLEALPFILLGIAVSSLVQLFVSEHAIRRLVPRHAAAGVVFACLLGILFPLCECGMVPVVRRLIRKGMPAYIAVVFLVAGPVLNPIVYASTYMAFRGHPEMAYARMGLAFAVALGLGLLLARFLKRSPLRDSSGHSHRHEHNHNHGQTHRLPWGSRLRQAAFHASDEFFEMGKYLMIGAIIAAAFQTAVNRESLAALGQDGLSSHLFMMGLAYVLSLCSTSDAFVAASFTSTFTKGSLLSFLVFGPMMDLKGTLMLLSVFRARFVLLLIMLTAIFVLAGSIAVEHLFLQ